MHGGVASTGQRETKAVEWKQIISGLGSQKGVHMLTVEFSTEAQPEL